ncbi:kinase binding protein CGI-121-domain-containing protein [Microdochium bolleyi]|uniref:EKC/KEOPS complex subunit CGI121 n=1 Tax=Microdochium bolleyi TaxID=196109 RepID=A0A136JGA0_9PEZI|nr:kinase binding protein CGI-121-domain-containing protein [Microdochium bolleyi]
MATLETIQLEHIPATHSVHVALYKDIQNAEFLQQQLLSRNQDFEYAFIDASCVVSRLQVLAAVHKAIMIQSGGNMKTPNIHSEIVCSLSPTNNIAEAYRRFGITPTSKDIIIVKVLISPASSSSSSSPPPEQTATAETVAAHLAAHVQGTPSSFTDAVVAQGTDWAKVRKYYKLNSGVAVLDGLPKGGADGGDEARRRELETLVLGGMALRGI